MVYDAGAAIYNHITGDHKAAKSNWIDAGIDMGAVLLPGIPAGMSKAAKGVEAVKNASKAKAGGKLKNAAEIAEGKAFEKQTLNEAIQRGDDVVSQVTIVPLNGKGNVKGNRSRADQLVRNKDDSYTVREAKRTNKTRLTRGQQATETHIGKNGGMFEIRKDIEPWDLQKNKQIFIKNFERKNKYEF